MDKQYKLPKEFATKWLAALRSGEYKQGVGLLLNGEESDEGDCEYCCIGVACLIAGNERIEFAGREWIDVNTISGVPDEIRGEPSKSELIKVLSDMNDGNRVPRMTFPEIADWIENNCELY